MDQYTCLGPKPWELRSIQISNYLMINDELHTLRYILSYFPLKASVSLDYLFVLENCDQELKYSYFNRAFSYHMMTIAHYHT